jgi:hypothetical protein
MRSFVPLSVTAVLVPGLVLASWLVTTRADAQINPADLRIPAAGEVQELVLKDGSRAFGRLEKIDGDRLTFRTASDAVIGFEVKEVVSLRIVQGRIVNGRFLDADPNVSRLFFAPTGRSLEKGEGYFGIYEMFLPFVQVGLTDRISIGGGTPLYFGGDGDRPIWFTPKVQLLARPRTRLAVGVLHFTNLDNGNLGIAYGVVTQGTGDAAVTVGVGYGYIRTEGERGVSAWA